MGVRIFAAQRWSVDAAADLSIRTSLSGKRTFNLGGGRKLMPLLHPVRDSIPFGVALEMWECENGIASSQPTNEVNADSWIAANSDLYELNYILHGHGKLAGANGDLECLKAGDSVIMPYKKAWCLPTKGPTVLDMDMCNVLPWELVSLKLLLPSELLLSDDGSTTDVGLAEAACEDWFTGQEASKSLSIDHVQQLLTGMQSIAQHASQMKSQQPTVRRFGLSPPTQNTNTLTKESGSFWKLPFNFLKQVIGNDLFDAEKDHQCVVKRSLQDLCAFRLPNQTNRLALVFDPTQEDIPFTFGVEIFERGHHTKPHVHVTAHELFFILSGEGEGFCNGHRFNVKAGDTVVFPPGSVHGVDNGMGSKMYCLEMMLPNEMFAEFVKGGQPAGGLNNEDLCTLIAVGCS